ncbi:hypothetical protein L1999_28065 [Neobacillus drentensis]|uniref:hypothetical protein n=1 Tax=Neobacillus drentensis TaxID=220684 RepID=UPI001F239170|nr:hypothetical protein [Neobacillus drentensis]ULT56820.1 hypothetical protein L1999_28065 [Neobacillus drentensis]
MNPTFIDFHKKRYEWVLKALKDFSVRFNEWKNEAPYTTGMTKSVEGLVRMLQLHLEPSHETSFNGLKNFFQEAEKVRQSELENVEKQLEPYQLLITKQTSILEHEKENAHLLEERLLNDINRFDQFQQQIELKNMDSDHIWELVDDIIEYTPYNKKASVINYDVSRLQNWAERELGNSLLTIKQKASDANIELGQPLELPFLPPLPEIEQKIDAFWFKTTYEKALSTMREQAHEWLTEMYQNYNHLLKLVLTELTRQKEQAIKEVEAGKLEYRTKINSLENQLVTYQKEEAELKARYLKACQLWEQFSDHASQLQGYLIKYWLDYKEELQQHLLYGQTEDRWLSAHYLQLLRQDGENMIESLTKGGHEDGYHKTPDQ